MRHDRPGGTRLVAKLLVAAMASWACVGAAQAQITAKPKEWQRPGQPTLCWNAATNADIACTDWILYNEDAVFPIRRAFLDKDFEQLDQKFDRWCGGADRFVDGQWPPSFYGDGLLAAVGRQMSWDGALATIEAWRAARPASEAARFAEALYWRQFAWHARGEGFSETVSSENWRLFQERLNRTAALLSKIDFGATPCPAFFSLAITTLTDLGAPASALDAIFAEGSRRYPEYHPIWFARSRAFEPKWGGSYEAFDAFARDAARRTQAFEGMGLYARLYRRQDEFRNDPDGGHRIRIERWPDLKAGHSDLVRKYPKSLRNAMKLAGLACENDDTQTYRRTRPRLVGYEIVWTGHPTIAMCDARHGTGRPAR